MGTGTSLSLSTDIPGNTNLLDVDLEVNFKGFERNKGGFLNDADFEKVLEDFNE